MQASALVLSFVAIILSVIALVFPDKVTPNIKMLLWGLWILGPPIWFIVEYLAYYNNWFNLNLEEKDMEHLKHVQSLMMALWAAVAALFYWLALESRKV